MGQRTRVWPFESVGFGAHRWRQATRYSWSCSSAAIRDCWDIVPTSTGRLGRRSRPRMQTDLCCTEPSDETENCGTFCFASRPEFVSVPDGSLYRQSSAGQLFLPTGGCRSVRFQSRLRQSRIQQHSICFHRQEHVFGDYRNPWHCPSHLPAANNKSISPQSVRFSQSAVAPVQPTSSDLAQSGISFIRTSIQCAIDRFF